MWPSLRRKVWLLGVVVAVASCGGGSVAEDGELRAEFIKMLASGLGVGGKWTPQH